MRELMASCVCVQGLVPSWLEVRVLFDSVCVLTRARRRPSKSLAKVSLRVEFLLKTESGYLRDAEVA